jgi:hypothetical protein
MKKLFTKAGVRGIRRRLLKGPLGFVGLAGELRCLVEGGFEGNSEKFKIACLL